MNLFSVERFAKDPRLANLRKACKLKKDIRSAIQKNLTAYCPDYFGLLGPISTVQMLNAGIINKINDFIFNWVTTDVCIQYHRPPATCLKPPANVKSAHMTQSPSQVLSVVPMTN